MTTELINELSREFPQAQIHWRAQTVRNGKALALAYIDARDVMRRLDEVIGPANWQDMYSIYGDRVICRLGIRFGEEWVWKSDGAGETQVEGDKGAISDAFKRAAVKWGIGRYLYSIPAPWVPCEERNGKFSKFTADPWQFVSAKQEPVFAGKYKKMELEKRLRVFCEDLESCEDSDMLVALLTSHNELLNQCRQERPTWWFGVEDSDVKGIGERITLKERELREPSRPAAGTGGLGSPAQEALTSEPSSAASPPDDGKPLLMP
jgi:hypothetical protein